MCLKGSSEFFFLSKDRQPLDALRPPPRVSLSAPSNAPPPKQQTLTFGDYRRPSLLERCVLALAAVGPVGWKAFSTFRKLRRTWAKVAVAVVAPAVAWVVRSVLGYLYR